MTIPKLTDEQRRAALKKGLKERQKRAQIKRQLASGTISFATLLNYANKDKSIARIKVFDAIKAVPDYGKAKTEKLMQELSISQNRRLGGLGTNQRIGLLNKLS